MARNPFTDAYDKQMSAAFGDDWGQDTPFGQFLAAQQDDAQQAWRRLRRNRPGMHLKGFFNEKHFSPDALRDRFDAMDRDAGAGSANNRPNPDIPIPGGANNRPNPDDGLDDDLWERDNPDMVWRRQMQGYGFGGDRPFDAWADGEYQHADLDFRKKKMDVGNPQGYTFEDFLAESPEYGKLGMRDRYFSMGPRSRGETAGAAPIRWSWYN